MQDDFDALTPDLYVHHRLRVRALEDRLYLDSVGDSDEPLITIELDPRAALDAGRKLVEVATPLVRKGEALANI